MARTVWWDTMEFEFAAGGATTSTAYFGQARLLQQIHMDVPAAASSNYSLSIEASHKDSTGANLVIYDDADDSDLYQKTSGTHRTSQDWAVTTDDYIKITSSSAEAVTIKVWCKVIENT